MKKTRKIATVAGLLMATLFVNQECQSQTATPPAQAPASAATQPAAPAATAPAAGGGAASAKAVVKFTGTAPAMAKLKREADPFCGKTPMNDQEVVVNPNGTLKNVAVRVTQGAPAAPAPAEPKIVDQNNCMYAPRVIGGQTGQKLLVRNSDPIMHNVHTYQGTTTGFNQAQMKGSKDIEKTIPAGVTKFKCDVHPWMTGFTVGNENPHVCVTGDNGECDLGALPPGTYTIEAWHEKYGPKTAQLTVAAGQPAMVEFNYAAQ